MASYTPASRARSRAAGTLIDDLAQRLGRSAAASHRNASRAALRRGEVLIGETALVHGECRAIGLASARLLPFNA